MHLSNDITFGICLVFYFFPTVCAFRCHHPKTPAIFVLNLALGWTLVGWLVAMAWASGARISKSYFTRDFRAGEPPRSPRKPHERSWVD